MYDKAPLDPYELALRRLARRSYSMAELRRALERQCGPVPAVAAAIRRLRGQGLLDDQRTARQVASSLARNRSFGRMRVRRELKSRLFDYRQIEPALDAAFSENDEHALLARALEKKLRTIHHPLTPRKIFSLCQSLMRLGFRSDDIMKAVRSRPELRPDAEEVELPEDELRE